MSDPKLHVVEAGEGRPVVLLHGLTATNRYVVHGSRALERSGHRVLAYDARGHGASEPAPSPEDYGYDALAADLERVLDERDLQRVVLAGASMGAHTLLRFALAHPERAAGLVVITPAYDGRHPVDGPGRDRAMARWDALSDGLRTGGVEGFVEAYGDPGVPEAWRETVISVLRQRLARHEHPEAVADALRAVPRSRPFGDLEDLRAITAPTVVVADRDEADPGHPLAVGEAYADAIPGARLVVEEPGESPVAWSGGKLSQIIAEVAERAFA
ncbi:alpha/beta fold hydrolase [Paraconexibacter sp.]|uniref:alpha/beta fold hydrolase n=1 Tax=Paraconexibacter sp. TaxID=2949640 RepID=UPI003569F765